MILEDQRFLHEDLERLEQAIAERSLEDPKNIRERLARDHTVSNFLTRIQTQSERLLDIYADKNGSRAREIQDIGTGDPFEHFYKEYNTVKDFHKRYPNEGVENLERAYKRRAVGETDPFAPDIDGMFTGEEGYGRFFDLTILHEEYMNLPGVKGTRRISYLSYLDVFDVFVPPKCPIKRSDKMTEAYFSYLNNLVEYLESFMRRTRPLTDLEKLFEQFGKEYDEAWKSNKVEGWEEEAREEGASASTAEGNGTGIWCPDCKREFASQAVYNSHLPGKKHKRAAAERAASGEAATERPANGGAAASTHRLKERAIADREFRVARLAGAMKSERDDTRVNVERKQGMTERERQQELDALYAEGEEPSAVGGGDANADDDDEAEDKIYNPLKLPLAWDGKPIPYWLYKLHGLGVEFPCQICGNFVYMGRRAFDKHFNEARHIYGLKCLGITNTTLFREITQIEEAQRLWAKIVADKKAERVANDNVVQMEDGEGNVMPEKVYYDLQKQGLL
ncbi:uncharacterized protein K452DRAFT_277504 [Aplosporella prunicola CBS 121167]|uniref:Matrin-type domain-containing protein n=1 Tax=Aplosporella prunicola CBS 121167 TaxID=1176127 RepID=A0A6A6B520_9PEZI|nr:uncharacterized protein K452DRAFT_277504 [Aplosporella prunicola CBS 121167]KAF2138375.1 hypothetical protein K452DRAFT_277504 [Aplosporella prunicola CBS 121167]